MAQIQTSARLGVFRRQEHIFGALSNNVSNAHTVGFKKDVPIFKTLLGESQARMGQIVEDGTKTVFDQGELHKTGNELDVAIEGPGFFKVNTPQGVRYSRAGNLGLDRQKKLVHTSGYPMLGEKGEITLAGKNIAIGKDGTVRMDGTEVARLAVVEFRDPDLLKKEGASLFKNDELAEETLSTKSVVHQGSIEASNVNPVTEMVKLIESLRSYEACIKVIQSGDEMDGKSVNEVGRT
jgi:flagellar basal-body rod protein FlgF